MWSWFRFFGLDSDQILSYNLNEYLQNQASVKKIYLGVLLALFCFISMQQAMAMDTTGSMSGMVHGSDKDMPAPLINNPFLQSTYLTIISGENTQSLVGLWISPNKSRLMGKRVSSTDERGHFQLIYLPPGQYTVTVNLPGFITVIRSEVTVSLGKDTSLHFTMKSSAFSESIEVYAASPVIDMNTATTGGTITQQDFARLPIQRTYQDAAALYAGVDNSLGNYNLTMAGSPSMLDSSGAENNYIIDGFTTTDPFNGTCGTDLTFNFIEEVDIKTGGYEAEYGRSMGGIINVITKSGGNTFTGNLITFFNTYEMNASGKYGQYRGNTSDWIGNQDYDVGVDLGGYMVKDKLWFFLSFNPSFKENKWAVEHGQTRKGELTTNHFAAKLTWSIVPRHRLVFSAFGDPSHYEGCDLSTILPDDMRFIGADPKFVAAADESAYQKIIHRGSQNYILKYIGIMNDSFVAEASMGYRSQRESSEPALEEGNAVQEIFGWVNPEDHGYSDHPEYKDGYVAGGVGEIHNFTKYRKMFDVKGTYYLRGHTLKAGLNYEQNSITSTVVFSGGQLIKHYPDTDSHLANSHYIFKMSGHGTVRNISTSVFVQDNWQVNNFLTVNMGLRLETQDLEAADGSKAFKISNNMAPRLSFSWDVMNNNKSKIFGSYGRFYESIPLQMSFILFSSNRAYFTAQLWDNGPDNIPGTDDDSPRSSTDDYLSEVSVDPDLKGQCLDEYLLGYDYEVLPDLALGVVVRYRKILRIIEDKWADFSKEERVICNPGEGLARDLPKPKREYTAVELTTSKKFSNHYQFYLSYIWSTLWGNYDGLYDHYMAGVWCNSSPMFNSETNLDNALGYLYEDIRHRFKFHGAFAFDCGLTVGSLVKLQSGRAISALSREYGGYAFEEKRGSQGRTPWLWQWDLHAEYDLQFWKKINSTVLLDVFNVTNNNEVMTVQNFKYNYFDSYHKNGSWHNPSPYWKEPLTYQIPRILRLGVRFSF